MKSSSLNKCLQILYIIIVTFILIVNYIDTSNPWGDWQYDPGPWCEKERTDSWIREPSNSIADFLFLAFVFYLISKGYQDSQTKKYQQISETVTLNNIIIKNPGITYFGAILHTIHFCGTFWNHSCRCHPGHRLDVVGMYSIASYPAFIWLVLLAFQHRFKCQNNNNGQQQQGILSFGDWVKILLAFAGVFSFYFWVSDYWYANHMWEVVEISIMFIISFATLYIDHITRKQLNLILSVKKLGYGVIFLIIGVTVHNLDMKKILCYPESPLQGHAIWHCVTSVTVYLLYDYQRCSVLQTEKEQSKKLKKSSE